MDNASEENKRVLESIGDELARDVDSQLTAFAKTLLA